jgi:hypothetical protein
MLSSCKTAEITAPFSGTLTAGNAGDLTAVVGNLLQQLILKAICQLLLCSM